MNSNKFNKEKKSLITFFNKKKFLDVVKNGTKLLEQEPDDTQIIRILGITSINIQNFIEAEKYFKKLLFFEKNAENYYTLGNIQKKSYKFHEAVISFQNAIKINPNDLTDVVCDKCGAQTFEPVFLFKNFPKLRSSINSSILSSLFFTPYNLA